MIAARTSCFIVFGWIRNLIRASQLNFSKWTPPAWAPLRYNSSFDTFAGSNDTSPNNKRVASVHSPLRNCHIQPSLSYSIIKCICTQTMSISRLSERWIASTFSIFAACSCADSSSCQLHHYADQLLRRQPLFSAALSMPVTIHCVCIVERVHSLHSDWLHAWCILLLFASIPQLSMPFRCSHHVVELGKLVILR